MGLIGALQFLTRLPIRTRRAPPMAASVTWFPVVGAMIGALVGGVAAVLGEIAAPGVAAAIGLVAGVLVTGAFHEDGLADLADAVAGGTTTARRREILKDPRHGTYGVTALTGSMLVRWSALAALVEAGPGSVLLASIAAHTLARGGAVATMAWRPPGPGAGLGATWMREVRPWQAILALALSAVALVPPAGGWTPVVVAVSAGGALVVIVTARRALGSVGGDALGAIEQVGEACALVALSVTIG
ncbi:MAG: adenosylcobinamide-GDP ribazoletransferase [Desertimonas sp.]